jgi:hypothetical protein
MTGIDENFKGFKVLVGALLPNQEGFLEEVM